jgi:hypothetical protein
MKPQYEQYKALILQYANEWETRLGLSHLTIEHRFLEAFKSDDDTETQADTQFNWEYRHGVMRWFLPAVIRQTPEDLRADVCHEYVHTLTASMEVEMPDRHTKVCEYAVQSLTLAILHATDVIYSPTGGK